MNPVVIKVENLSKSYRLGLIGGKTLREDLNRWWALVRRKPDPTLKIGQEDHGNIEGETIWALRDVSFEVQQGEVLGIIGRNGAGKSTLLKIISRITAPTSGQIKIKGRVGSLLEVGTGFHPELTGRENIYLNGTILGMKRAEIDAKFDEIVDFSGVEQFIDTPVKRYSSGMYVRLAFAVAAHLDPDILVVDEVLAVGDIGFQKKCLDKMEDISDGGRTVLFVSHNMAAVSSLCSRSLLLVDGHLQSMGNTDKVIEEYRSQVQVNEQSGNSLTERKDRTGSGTLQFNQLHFVRGIYPNQYNETDLVSGQPASIIMECKSAVGEPLKNVAFVIVIRDLHDNPLFTLHTRFTGELINQFPDVGEVICRIPRLPLAPGRYRVDLRNLIGGTMGSLAEVGDHIDNAGEFSVVAGDFFGSGHLPNPRKHGPFLIDHVWAINRAVADTTARGKSH